MSDETIATQFQQAIEQDDLPRIRRLLDEHPGLLDQRFFEDGDSVLHLARSPEVLDLFLNAGAEVDCRNLRGWTPLCDACIGSLWKGKPLLERGADINARSCDGLTPLHVAAMFLGEGAIDHLLDHGADIDAADDRGYTPLLTSFDDTNRKTARRLWARGAKRSLEGACYLGKLSYVQTALEADPGAVRTRDGRGRTPLHWASCLGQMRVAKLLLARGADVASACDEFGWTPLHFAAFFSGSLNYLDLLLNHGAAVDARDPKGRTPLHLGARRWWPRKVIRLVKRGANVNAEDSSGRTPLDQAIECGELDVLKALRRLGAVTGRSHEGPEDPSRIAAT